MVSRRERSLPGYKLESVYLVLQSCKGQVHLAQLNFHFYFVFCCLLILFSLYPSVSIPPSLQSLLLILFASPLERSRYYCPFFTLCALLLFFMHKPHTSQYYPLILSQSLLSHCFSLGGSLYWMILPCVLLRFTPFCTSPIMYTCFSAFKWQVVLEWTFH